MRSIKPHQAPEALQWITDNCGKPAWNLHLPPADAGRSFKSAKATVAGGYFSAYSTGWQGFSRPPAARHRHV